MKGVAINDPMKDCNFSLYPSAVKCINRFMTLIRNPVKRNIEMLIPRGTGDKDMTREDIIMAILAECPGCRNKASVAIKKCRKCGTDIDKAKRSSRVAYWIDYRVSENDQNK
jgi:hypothetical protein